MKIIANQRTTRFETGQYIVDKWHFNRCGKTIVYKILDLVPCATSTHICRNCSTGNVAYLCKRYTTRLGVKVHKLCASDRESGGDYLSYNRLTGSVGDPYES